MAAAAETALSNFVGGKQVPALDGRTSAVVDPRTGEAYLRAPVSGAADVDAALNTAAEAFDTWRNATPAERSLALLRFADAVEARAEAFIEAESRNPGKPVTMTRTDEVPPLVDELRFFAGAARILEGRSGGGVPARPPLEAPRGADRGLRPGHALELPDDDGGLEDRPRAGR